MNIVTIFLGVTVGATAMLENFFKTYFGNIGMGLGSLCYSP